MIPKLEHKLSISKQIKNQIQKEHKQLEQTTHNESTTTEIPP